MKCPFKKILNRKYLLLAGLLILFLSGCRTAYADTSTSSSQHYQSQQIQQMDTGKIDQFWDSLVTKYNGFIPDSDRSVDKH